MQYIELREIVKKRRKVLHISQERLAELSEVSLRTIIEFESGQGNPTLKTLENLAEVLGLELKLEIKKL